MRDKENGPQVTPTKMGGTSLQETQQNYYILHERYIDAYYINQ
jgi:hypothetical protein